MSRRRYQHPPVRQTATKDATARRWYFTARTEKIVDSGEIGRKQGAIYLGKVSELSKRAAEKERDRICAERINRPSVTIPSQVRFGVVLDRFIATIAVKETSAAAYRSAIKCYLRPQWGETRMADITPLAVDEWLVKLASSVSKQYLRSIKNRFAQIWRQALRWGFTREAVPTFGSAEIKRFGRPTRDKKLPTPDQFRAFIAVLEEPYRSVVVVAALTGLRIGEVLALTWAQINSPVARIFESVNQLGIVGPTKTEDERLVPMAPRADIGVSQLTPDTDRPFLMRYGRVRERVKAAAEQIGIYYPGFGCHTFRRLHNTYFRRQVERPEVVDLARAQLGHADARTNDLYYVAGEHDIQRRADVSAGVREKFLGRVN